VFKSRRITSERFIAEFFETLTPGVIPREHFIDWGRIKLKCKEFEDVIEYFAELSPKNRSAIRQEIQDTLLSSDDPFHIIKGSFELLGHTNNYYVSDRDNADFSIVAGKIKNGVTEQATYIA